MPAKRHIPARRPRFAVERFTAYPVRAVQSLRCDIGDRDVEIADGEIVTVVESREKARGTQLLIRTQEGQYAWVPAWLFELVPELEELHG